MTRTTLRGMEQKKPGRVASTLKWGVEGGDLERNTCIPPFTFPDYSPRPWTRHFHDLIHLPRNVGMRMFVVGRGFGHRHFSVAHRCRADGGSMYLNIVWPFNAIRQSHTQSNHNFNIRRVCSLNSQVTVRSQSGHSQVYSQVTVRSCKNQHKWSFCDFQKKIRYLY